MIDGECTYKKVFVIPANPSPSIQALNIPASPLPGCCSDFNLKVLADNSGNPLQNDVNTVIHWFDPIITGATMALKKWVNNAWISQATISDNTYGTYLPFGNFINIEGQNFISLKVSWANILTAFGTGTYKFTTSYVVPIFGNKSADSYEFCLQTYSAKLADNTVRLEYWITGVMGDIEDDTKIKDFGTMEVYNSFRLPGFFGYPKTTYKEDDIEYNTGQRDYVEDEQEPIFKLKLFLLPHFIHEILRTDFMMANERAITDYNSKNSGSYIQKFVRKNSGYEPGWYELQSNFASVELQFKQEFNRFRKLRN